MIMVLVKNFSVVYFFLCILYLISVSESNENFETNTYDHYESSEDLNVIHNTNEIKSRDKRFIRYNSFSALYIGILLGIPLTTALPIIGQDLLYSNDWSLLREERSTQTEEEFEDHRIVEPFLNKLSTYFQLLKISEKPCQIRAVCEFSANPKKFHPVSDLFLNKIYAKVPQWIYNERGDRNSSYTKRSLFNTFNMAANDGMASGEKGCLEKYRNCPVSLEKRVNMEVLAIWNFLSTIINLSLDDNLI